MKRWLARILICLVLGAVTTVAVAWGCSHWSAQVAGGYASLRDGATWPGRVPSNWPPPRYQMTPSTRGYSRVITVGVSDIQESGAVTFRQDLYQFGLPRRALQYAIHERIDPIAGRTYSTVGGIGSQTAVAKYNREHKPFPVQPIWPGFLIDALFYGAIWFGMIFGLGAARRAIRTRRGHCPKCAYDLRGNLDAGCPECGWNREEREA